MDIKEKAINKMHQYRDKAHGYILEKKLENQKNLYGLNCDEVRKEKVIVSMASYNKRYTVILMTLKSLLCQKTKPDRIIVWLDEKNESNVISQEMQELEKYGVEYRYTNDHLGAHKKYFYAMQEFPKDLIITVDDDLIYTDDMIGSLLEAHEKYPDAICARRVHKIEYDENQKILPYTKWKYEYQKQMKPSYLLCATGGAGTLYPPGALGKEAFNIECIKENCIGADDIWLKCMEVLNNRKVYWVKNHYVMPREVRNSQNQALNYENVANGKNDEYLKKVFQLYPKLEEKICEKQ